MLIYNTQIDICTAVNLLKSALIENIQEKFDDYGERVIKISENENTTISKKENEKVINCLRVHLTAKIT